MYIRITAAMRACIALVVAVDVVLCNVVCKAVVNMAIRAGGGEREDGGGRVYHAMHELIRTPPCRCRQPPFMAMCICVCVLLPPQ